MNQPYGLGGGVAPPPAPPPGGVPPQWHPPTPQPPPPRGRRTGLIVGAVAALLATALVAGAAGAVITSSRDTAAPAPTEPTNIAPAPAANSPTEAAAALCNTLETEYPKIVDAINDRNQYNKTPWTDPAIIASSDNLARVMSEAADSLEGTLSADLPARYRTPAIEYVAGLRAMSVSHRERAKDMQLNGVASFYNSVIDPMLAVCGMEG